MLLIIRCLIYIKSNKIKKNKVELWRCTPLDIQRRFGLKVQQLRKETGMSQEKFALSIDMDRTYLASVEAGKRNISLCNIEKIAKGLNISIGELFSEL